MSANVETMMYVREKPWHGLGTMVEEAPNSAKALELAGLDWDVIQEDVLHTTGDIITGYKVNRRSTDGKDLGIVSNRYQIVQNKDAFSFTDSLIGGDVRYETAGSLNGGRTVWMLANMPEAKIAGDEVEQYLCFKNSHDGTGAVKVCLTPVRVVCNNTLNFALSTAKRSFSIKHMGDIDSKIEEARQCLELADRYMLALDEYAEAMTKINVDDEMLKKVIDNIFKLKKDATEREKKTVEQAKEDYMVCYFMPDIAKFRGTAWGAINAMTDYAAHNPHHKETRNYAENNWGRIMDGHTLVDQMVSAMNLVH